MKDLQHRLAAEAAEFFALASGDGGVAPLGAVLASDGRAARRTPAGTEWVRTIAKSEAAAVFAIATELAKDRARPFFIQDEDGTTLSGVLGQQGGQLVLALPATRRLSASDFSEALPEPMFAYLRALASLGENLWICGDTGFELAFGAALAPDEHGTLLHARATEPPPYGTVSLDPSFTIEDALRARALGAFSTLVHQATLEPQLLAELSLHEGVILVQHASATDRALARSGILSQRDSALALASFGAIVSLGRTPRGGMIVRHIAECQAADEGVAYTLIAGREGENARWLLPASVPHRLTRLAEAGLDEAAIAFAPLAQQEREDEQEDEQVPQPPLRRAPVRGRFVSDDAAELEEERASFEAVLEDDEDMPGADTAPLDHADPGWELDASGASTLRAAARKTELVQAPGPAGREGFLRARPVVRPSPREPAAEPGTLTLDLPQRKVIIPEAPSGSAAKRTFAEIMRERHRYPPVSEHGPTLTPPVLRAPPEGREDDEEDITP